MNVSRFLLLILMLLLMEISLLAAACAPAPDPRLAALEGTVEALASQNARLEEALVTQAAFADYLATRPPPLVTPISPGTEPTPHRPVQGSVRIEEGRCCAGGPAGEPLAVTVQFEAASPLAEVSEMRWAMSTQTLDEEAVATLDWEPFAVEKMAEIPVPSNWSSMAVTVQFRDAEGNLSPLYSDDIAVEGLPPQP
jgi:hypothetical protein